MTARRAISDRGVHGGTGTVRAAFRAVAARLRAAGVPSPELDARIVVCAAAGIGHEAFAADPDRVLPAEAHDTLERYVAQRAARCPVSRILGQRAFWGHDFALGPATLDPRPDSETLVEEALAILRAEGRGDAPLTVLDLGTGTGCLLLSLLVELPRAFGLGVDISVAALHVARANAERLGVGDRARFVCGYWLAAIGGRFDVAVANPPYIRSGDIAGLAPEVAFDPRLALDGGADGLDAYRAILPDLGSMLAPGGVALIELGAGQAPAVAALLDRLGLPAAFRRDLAGVERCAVLRGNAPQGARKKELENPRDRDRVRFTEPIRRTVDAAIRAVPRQG